MGIFFKGYFGKSIAICFIYFFNIFYIFFVFFLKWNIFQSQIKSHCNYEESYLKKFTITLIFK